MEYVHVRNLEKFHPGYKDRNLTWGKIFINMAQGDPDVEELCEIDFSRLIKLILLELRAQKPLPNSVAFWQHKGFDINFRPMSLTLQMLQKFVVVVSNNSEEASRREEKRREDKIRKETEKPSPYWAAFSKETQDLLKTVFKNFNVYQLLGRLKKESKGSVELPEEVVVLVCERFLKNKEQIRATWPWFKESVVWAWEMWNASKNQKEGQSWKETTVSMKDLLKCA